MTTQPQAQAPKTRSRSTPKQEKPAELPAGSSGNSPDEADREQVAGVVADILERVGTINRDPSEYDLRLLAAAERIANSLENLECISAAIAFVNGAGAKRDAFVIDAAEIDRFHAFKAKLLKR